jgi:hypothetical protein
MSTSRTREKADGELFKSTGIDDNATSTAVTIDANENVMVGTTNNLPAVNNVEGIALSSGSYGGRLEASRNGGAPAAFNRIGGGSVVEIKADGTTVATIGSTSGVVGHILLDTRSSAKGAGLLGSSSDANTGILQPVDKVGALADGAIELGTPANRFKNLYLSGGVVFGPASASNVSSQTLDSYEEGTWTPVVTGGTSSPSSVTWHTPPSGTYTKTGRVVTIAFYLHINTVTGGSGSFQLNGAPFASITPSGGFSGAISLYQVASSSYSDPVLHVGSGSIGIMCASGANGSFDGVAWGRAPLSVFASGSAMSGTVTYFAS